MTKASAKQTGSIQALISVCIGLVIAYVIMGFFSGFLWFFQMDNQINIISGAVIMFVCGHFFGKRAGIEILIKQKNYRWVGIKYGIAALITTVLLASLIGFFQEGIVNIGTNDNPFEDYIFKPFYWVVLYGIIPVLIVGYWFGKQIKKRGNV